MTSKSINKPVGVLGGGVAGLAAALKLLENGQKIILIESSSQVGGVAASTEIPEKRTIPVGYHQIVGSDKKLVDVLTQLGLISEVKWKNTHVSVLVDGKKVDLASPKDILLFQRLPLFSRLKYMSMGARCLLTKDWSQWENRTVTELVESWADEKVLKEIFGPLVDIKFGLPTNEADAAWLGRRLSHSEGKIPFGYIPNTSWTHELCLKFKNRIEELGGEIMLGSPLKSLILDSKDKITSVVIGKGKKVEVKAVINTIPSPAFCSILANSFAPSKWLEILGEIKYISCYSLLAGLPFVPFNDYWTVVLHPRRIFGGCFTVSILNDTLVTKKDQAVINLFTNVRYGQYQWSLKGYNKLAMDDLEKTISRKVKPNWIQTNIIKFVSPIFSLGYKNPPVQLGPNLYLAGVYRTYPKFSSTGEVMANGVEAAEELLKSL